MRSILVLLVITMVSAVPQYNYQQQQAVGQAIGQAVSPAVGNIGYAQQPAIDIRSGFSGSVSSSGGAVFQQQNQPLLGGVSNLHNQFIPVHKPAPIITKDVYIHSAPEEPEEDLSHFNPNSNQIPERKHYRIIFIKAPAQSNKAAALRLAQVQAKSEEKTIIYVLSKKTDAADIQEALQQVAPTSAPSKPEVFFIKYKTQEEANHAQQQIQAQYDALGGTSSVSDEGIAPIHSVIGSLGNNGASGGHNNYQQTISSHGTPFGKTSAGYLPPFSRH